MKYTLKAVLTLLFAVIISLTIQGCTNKTAQIKDKSTASTYVSEKEKLPQIKEPENIVTQEPETKSDDALQNQNSKTAIQKNTLKDANTQEAEKELTCTLLVRCDTILNNMDLLIPEKTNIVPSDGVIFKKQTITFKEGESVFDLLLRVMKDNKIHMEYESTPAFDSTYIEGIGNLYEFDCGELSGWVYRVNGIFPNYGCSRYMLKDGDSIEWLYTCDLGADVGKSKQISGE